MILLIQFFLAHIIGDFFLQPDKWVKEKKLHRLKSIYLYLHVSIHFILILAITGNIAFWKIALIISAIHLVIDGAKLYWQKEGTLRTWFFADQLLHIATIFIVWSFQEKMIPDLHVLCKKEWLVPVTAILFVLNPASFIIKTAISKWTPHGIGQDPGETTTGEATTADTSLENAGRLIGIMERLLVLVFVFLGKWEGIGFLLTAKSVFRFGDIKDARSMKLTEYVLIGTFLSFGIAIMTGLIALQLLAK
jgi:hypothetical protein